MTYRPYTGVGSRETPPRVLNLMRYLADGFARNGLTLRTGGAQGADSAFEEGARRALTEPLLELYLPWPRFEQRTDHVRLARPQKAAFDIAAEHHPRWMTLSWGARALHARNVHQVLGPDVTNPTPSEFVICWTRRGEGGGGTGQAIRVARAYGVKVVDVGFYLPSLGKGVASA